MSAYLIFHHGAPYRNSWADKHLNDPWVWSSPFLWSHCNARNRPREFGKGSRSPLVAGHDVAFFVSWKSNQLVFDCVFVVDRCVLIQVAEQRYKTRSFERKLHFDQRSNEAHRNSTRTFIANMGLSFLPTPPVRIGAWIENLVVPGKMTVHQYFGASNGRRNARVIRSDAEKLYLRIKKCAKMARRRPLSRSGLARKAKLRRQCEL